MSVADDMFNPLFVKQPLRLEMFPSDIHDFLES